MQSENHEGQPRSRQEPALGEVARDTSADLARFNAEVAELIRLRLLDFRLLLASVDHDPAPEVLERIYAAQPHLRGSEMFEPKRCSFCARKGGKVRGFLIEGNGARICTDCIGVIGECLSDAGAE